MLARWRKNNILAVLRSETVDVICDVIVIELDILVGNSKLLLLGANESAGVESGCVYGRF